MVNQSRNVNKVKIIRLKNDLISFDLLPPASVFRFAFNEHMLGMKIVDFNDPKRRLWVNLTTGAAHDTSNDLEVIKIDGSFVEGAGDK